MIQSILFFMLGFLCAGFLALMVAPAIWRRAVVLTRKRIEASAPISADEIQADKDRLRAEFAVSTRKLEMSIKALNEKAALQLIDINRKREELRQRGEDIAGRDARIAALEASAEALRGELGQREEQVEALSGELAQARDLLDERAQELEKLGHMYDDASFSASERQIELAAREAEVEKLTGDVAEQRELRKEAERRVREANAASKALLDELKLEKRRAGEAEKRLERALASLSDVEEKLDRREKEVERLREEATRRTREAEATRAALQDELATEKRRANSAEKRLERALANIVANEEKLGGRDKDVSTLRDRMALDAGKAKELSAALAQAQEQKVKLEAEVARLTRQIAAPRPVGGDDGAREGARAEDARKRLEDRLTTLTRENKKLRDRVTAMEGAKADGEEERRENALLREQINDLAAEVVNFTLMLEGPDSAIGKALAQPPSGEAVAGHVSLADRVRALQKAMAGAPGGS